MQMTVLEIRPHPWGWKVFESPGVEPVFPEKRQAIDYAETRACAKSLGDAMRAVLSTFLDCSDQSYVGTLVLIHVIENAILMGIYTAIIIAQRLGKGDSPRTREFVALPGIYFVSGSP